MSGAIVDVATRPSAISPVSFSAGRRTSRPRRCPRHRAGAGDEAGRNDAGARRHRRPRGACARRHDPSGDADVPGAADFRQRRTRRTGARTDRGRARAQTVRPARRGGVSLARGPHRQEFPHGAQPGAVRVAPSAGDRCRSAELSRADAPARNGRRNRDRRQSARPFGQTARRRTHRSAAREADAEALLPQLPSLDDIMRGRP